MSVNDNIRNKDVKHSVYLQRFANNEVKEILKLIKEAREKVTSKINKTDTVTNKRRKYLKEYYDNVIDVLEKKILDKTLLDYEELARIESNYQKKTLDSELDSLDVKSVIPNTKQIISSFLVTPLVTKFYKDFLKGWSKDQKDIFNATVRTGYINGETTQNIVRELYGTKRNKYKDGKLSASKTSIEREVRTALNSVANTTRQEFYKANDDIIKGYQWVSTLDSRTSLICISLDGLYDLYDGSVTQLDGQIPPAHPNCRSTTIPITKSFREMGFDVDEMPESTRASVNGQVSEKETYASWIKKQDAKTQKEVLGSARYKLWKEGKVEITNFVNNKNQILTLKELENKI